MRKPSKSFTVEVKRRPNSLVRKPPAAVAPLAAPEKQAADRLFAAPPDAPAEAAETQRRILPCLVTEAALDASRAVEPEPEPRRRGRPPKREDFEQAAHKQDAAGARERVRKIGVPDRKGAQPEAQEQRPPELAASGLAASHAKIAPVAAVDARPPRARAARRATASDLPRGERWKRRLPKVVR
ncbi:MAG: hypothetical protein ACK5JM_00170 [Rhodoblastus sp.]